MEKEKGTLYESRVASKWKSVLVESFTERVASKWKLVLVELYRKKDRIILKKGGGSLVHAGLYYMGCCG